METTTQPMTDIFEKGNKITTNGMTYFKVIDSNDYEVVLKDLLTDDFYVFNKTEHTYENVDFKVIFKKILNEILNETTTSEEDAEYIRNNMGIIFNKLL